MENDMRNKIVIFDWDGTVIYNFLDIDFINNIKIFNEDANSDLNNFRQYNTLNYMIRTSDVKHILTGRLKSKESVTREEMKRHGVDADLVMFGGEKHDVDEIIKFKSDYLNDIGADFYIDDDVLFCKKLEPHLKKTHAISTEEFYRDFLDRENEINF